MRESAIGFYALSIVFDWLSLSAMDADSLALFFLKKQKMATMTAMKRNRPPMVEPTIKPTFAESSPSFVKFKVNEACVS